MKQHTKLLSIFAVIMLIFTSCSEPPGRVVLKNCTVYTMDENNPTVEFVVCEGQKIIYAGDAREGASYEAKNVQIIDLAGAVVLPGLMDAHAHLLGYGKYIDELQLRGAESPEDIRIMVLKKMDSTPPGEWVMGRGWDQNKWDRKKFPTWRDLAGTEANPLYLRRVDGHAVWINRKAMEICGLTADTPDPEGGEIIRDHTGFPTGILLDNAVEMVKERIPEATLRQKRKWLLTAMKECNRVGITSVGDAWVDKEGVELFKSVVSEGEATLRVYALLEGKIGFMDEFNLSSPILNYGNGMLTIRSVKLFADGALGSRGALLFEPYSDRPETRGIMVESEENIFTITVEALKNGFQVCTHAIGDRANHITLSGYERALEKVPTEDHRLRVEHCQVLAPDDIPRFAESGVIASMQPTHATSDMPWAENRVGSERMRGAYAWRSLLDVGAKLAFGSDFPVEEPNPFLGIYAAVTRQDLEGYPPGGWFPHQRLTVMEAVRGFTIDAAYAQFQENELGLIRPGMLADFTVIDRDIFMIPALEIPQTEVLMTIVGGKVVYRQP